MRKLSSSLYWQMEKLIAPRLEFSQVVYEKILKQTVGKNSLWLDIGCGHNLLPHWRQAEERQIANVPHLIVGLDSDFASLLQHKNITCRVKGDIKNLPFKDRSFSLITANMVFEHLKQPEQQLREIFRVLKPGGLLIFHTPNLLGYATVFARLTPKFFKKKIIYLLQKRKEEDVFPTYYRINLPKRITTLAQESGFRVKEILLIPSSALLIVIPPLALLELLWIRLTMCDCFKNFRTNIIAQMEKPD